MLLWKLLSSGWYEKISSEKGVEVSSVAELWQYLYGSLVLTGEGEVLHEYSGSAAAALLWWSPHRKTTHCRLIISCRIWIRILPICDQIRIRPKKGCFSSQIGCSYIFETFCFLYKRNITCECTFYDWVRVFRPVFRIRDILVRIRIRGSVPSTIGSRSYSFRQWPSRSQ